MLKLDTNNDNDINSYEIKNDKQSSGKFLEILRVNKSGGFDAFSFLKAGNFNGTDEIRLFDDQFNIKDFHSIFSKLIIFISLRVFNNGNKGIPLIVYEEPSTDENRLQPSDSNL